MKLGYLLSSIASFNSWHQWSTNYTQQLLSGSTGGPVISGPWAAMGTWAGSCTFDGIREAQASSGLTMREVPCGCQPSANKIIQFLAAAEEGSYMHCMGNVNDGNLVNKTTFPEMDYALGAPRGPATEVPGPGSGVWHRTFATGAWVMWDNTRGNGTYYFPGEAPSPPGPPGPPGPPPPPGPPLPPVAPTATCKDVYLCDGVRHGDIKTTAASQWTTCCADCAATPGCTQWAFHASTPGAAANCRLHTDEGTKSPGTAKYCGTHNRTTH